MAVVFEKVTDASSRSVLAGTYNEQDENWQISEAAVRSGLTTSA